MRQLFLFGAPIIDFLGKSVLCPLIDRDLSPSPLVVVETGRCLLQPPLLIDQPNLSNKVVVQEEKYRTRRLTGSIEHINRMKPTALVFG